MYLAPENTPKSSATPAEVRPDQAILPASGLSDFLAAPQIAWLLNVFPSTDAPYLAAFHAVSNPDALVSFLALPDYAALKSLLAIQEPAAQQAYLNKMLPAPLAVATPPAEDSGPGEQESAQQHQPPETAAMMFPEVHSPAGEASGGGGSVTVILQSSPQGSPELPGAIGAQGGSSGSMSQLELAPPAEVNPALSHGESGFISSGGEEASVLDDLGGANVNEAAGEIGAQAEPQVVPEIPADGAAVNGAAANNLAPGMAHFLAHHPDNGAGDDGSSGINGSSGAIFHLQHIAQHGLSNRELAIAVVGGLGVVGAIVTAVVLSVESDQKDHDNNGTTPSHQTVPTDAPLLTPADTPPVQSDGHEDPPPTAAMMGPESGAPVGSGNLGGTVPVDSAGTTPVNLYIEANPGTGSGTTSAGAGSNNSLSPSPSSQQQVDYVHHSFDDADVSQDGSGSDIVPQDLDLPAPQDGSNSDIVAEDFNTAAPRDGSGSDIVADDFSPPAPQVGFLGGNDTRGLNPPASNDPVNLHAGQHDVDEWALPQHAGDSAFSLSLSGSDSRPPSPPLDFSVDMTDPINRITAGVVGVVLVSTGVGVGVTLGIEDHHASDNGADPAVAPPQNAIPLATLWAELAFSGVECGASAGSQQAHDFVASEPGIRTSLQNWISQNVPALIVNLAGFDTMPAAGTGAATTVHVNIELSAKDANAVAGQLAMSDLSSILASLRDYDDYGLHGLHGLNGLANAAPDWHVQFMGMDVISGEIRQEDVVAPDDSGIGSDYFAASNSPVPFADLASNPPAVDGNTALEINGVQTTLWSI